MTRLRRKAASRRPPTATIDTKPEEHLMYFAPAASPQFPAATPTVYTVTCLPEHVEDASLWSLTVEYRGRGLWAVKRHSQNLSRSGEWDWESIPSEREDEWLAEHRFPLEEALELAKQAAPHVIVNGMTPADLLAWHAAGRPRPIPRPHSRARAAKSETETSTT